MTFLDIFALIVLIVLAATGKARVTQIIRKVMVRMEAWMKYIIP